MSEEQKPEEIFLNDRSIIDWEQPLPPAREGMVLLRRPEFQDAVTRIVEPLALDKIDGEHLGPYILFASAAKYIIDFARWDGHTQHWESDVNKAEFLANKKTERGVLFEGAIQIYQTGEIPGTTYQGTHFLKSGKIWSVVTPPQSFLSRNGLAKLIFADAESDAQKSARIAAILYGYETQEIAAQERMHEAHHNSYRRGRLDATEH